MNWKPALRAIYAATPLKAPVFSVLRRHIKLSERSYRHLHFNGQITIEIDSKTAFYIHHYGYQVENDLFWAGFGNGWEGTSLRLWTKLAKLVGDILDIGANTGVFALSAKAVNSKACVVAFEPIERIYGRLVHNIDLNQYDVEAVAAGASNRSGEAKIYDTDNEHAYSASLDKEMLKGCSQLVERKIAIRRMDEFLAERELGTMLVKIDTEMHEYEVLDGFGHFIEDHRPCFLVEILDRETGLKIENRFNDLDYIYYEIREGQGIELTSEIGSGDRNFLICPKEFADKAGLGKGLQHEEL